MNPRDEHRDYRILVVDSVEPGSEQVVSVLTRENYLLEVADSVGSAVGLLENEMFDLVVIIHGGGDEPGVQIVEEVRYRFPDMRFLLLTTSNGVRDDLGAFRTGALDYLQCPFTDDELAAGVQRAVAWRETRRELTQLRQTVAMSYGFDNVVGISKPLVGLRATAQKLALTDITVLIEGAPGTGKGLLARAMHLHSKRRKGPFIAVDFSAIPEQLLASELFGVRDTTILAGGKDRACLLEQADGGTVFLDEMTGMPASLQARMADFLRDFEVTPVTSAPLKRIDVRIIVASSVDLSATVAEGKFSKEVFDRLNAITIRLPRLVQRAEDIEILTDYFLRRIAAETKRESLAISRMAVDKLLGYDWPGNVRELENCLKRAAALCQDNQLGVDDITFLVSDQQFDMSAADSGRGHHGNAGLLVNSQRSTIAKALRDNNWNFTQTAQELGIGRTTLWRKVKKYRLEKDHALEES